ncbi:DUF192 domain-containing protein [Erythrobacter oryzae]|uniref:DUF192 domain-containing protein n=1 Tax=Erythrobacter oryzae TaxID=3019556 RepID=UPI0025521638|nr:DUF192 domain-containing protein [Erythrobacter sp. COR-2]
MVRHILAGAALALALVACSPGTGATASAQAPASAEAARHPVSGLKVIDLVVDRGGKPLKFKVELADTPEAQAKGLMFRTELGDFEGMIFPSEVPEARAFWMKNTPISLDIIFIGMDGRVQNIAANTTPYSLDSVKSDGVASAVLELRAGRAKALGIVPGDKVSY